MLLIYRSVILCVCVHCFSKRTDRYIWNNRIWQKRFLRVVTQKKTSSSLIYLQKYGHMNEWSFNSAPFINQKGDQTDVREFQKFSRLQEAARIRRQATPDLCQDNSIDAATTTEDGRTYVFKGDYYWELNGVVETAIAEGYPRKINEDWEGLPGNLDAALTLIDGDTFFFKENQFWSFRNKKMDSGFPKAISDGFEGIPNCIDAAVVSSVDWKTYFFKGSNYWLHPPEENSPNPQPISNWEGLPGDFDAALRFVNQNTYFFKGRSYYRSDERIAAVSKDDPGGLYPRSNSVWWFGCQSTSDQDFINETSHHLGNKHRICMDGDEVIGSSTQIPMEKDYLDGAEKLEVDLQQNVGNDLATPPPQNKLYADSVALSCGNIFLTVLLLVLLHVPRN